ncbi:FtsB family cell division protein [Gordonia sp. CPCC 205333]|uniref:FtsB family cell division protein n=1 Tax=Gordonia sp. CPCC 205333 TaxID=3140790 RepID=UPI003AF34ADD
MAERPGERGDGSRRSRRGRVDRIRSTRPGGLRRTSGDTGPNPITDDDAVEPNDQVAQDIDADVDMPSNADDIEVEEAAPAARVRSARGARTNTPRPGFTQNALHRMRGVNPRHAVIMAVVLAFVILTLAMPMRTYFSQQSEFDQLRESNAQLHKEVADYQQKVNEQGDPAYTEAKARARLQYARPGETVLVLTFPGQAQRKAEEDRAAAKARNPWYGNLWDSVATPAAAK